MQIQDKIGGILYDYSRKPGSKEFWNRVWVPGNDYKSLLLRLVELLWNTENGRPSCNRP